MFHYCVGCWRLFSQHIVSWWVHLTHLVVRSEPFTLKVTCHFLSNQPAPTFVPSVGSLSSDAIASLEISAGSVNWMQYNHLSVCLHHNCLDSGVKSIHVNSNHLPYYLSLAISTDNAIRKVTSCGSISHLWPLNFCCLYKFYALHFYVYFCLLPKDFNLNQTNLYQSAVFICVVWSYPPLKIYWPIFVLIPPLGKDSSHGGIIGCLLSQIAWCPVSKLLHVK